MIEKARLMDEDVILIGIKTRGVPIANRIATRIEQI